MIQIKMATANHRNGILPFQTRVNKAGVISQNRIPQTRKKKKKKGKRS